MGFSRQEYWSGLPFPSPGDFPNPGIEPGSPTLQAEALSSEPPGRPYHYLWSLLKLMSIESGMPYNHLIFCCPVASCPQSFPASGSFLMSQLFSLVGQTIGASASASVLPMSMQDSFPSAWTGWISLQSKGLSRVFSNTTVQKHQFFCIQLSLWSKSHICT